MAIRSNGARTELAPTPSRSVIRPDKRTTYGVRPLIRAGGGHYFALSVWGAILAITIAELTIVLGSVQAGYAMHIGIFVALLVVSGLVSNWNVRTLLLSVALAPLIRIVSAGLPLGALPPVSWYVVTSIPVVIAANLVARQAGWTLAAVGLRSPARGSWPLEIGVALLGVPLGIAEYLVLRPEALPLPAGAMGLALGWLVMWLGTGLFEEFVFRGLLQKAAGYVLTPGSGILFVSTLFAVLHIGHGSVIDVWFVFLVGIIFGAVVAQTGSIWGVSIAHGLTNTLLFIVLPRHEAEAVLMLNWGVSILDSMLQYLVPR